MISYDEFEFKWGKESTWGTAVARSAIALLSEFSIKPEIKRESVSKKEIRQKGYSTGNRITYTESAKFSAKGCLRHDDYFLHAIQQIAYGDLNIYKPSGATNLRNSVFAINGGINPSTLGGLSAEGYYNVASILGAGLIASKITYEFNPGEEITFTIEGIGKSALDLDPATTPIILPLSLPFMYSHGEWYINDQVTPKTTLIGKAKLTIDFGYKVEHRYGSKYPVRIIKGDVKADLDFEMDFENDDEWDEFRANNSIVVKMVSTHDDVIESTNKHKASWTIPRYYYGDAPLPDGKPSKEKVTLNLKGECHGMNRENCNINDALMLSCMVNTTGYADKTAEAKSSGGTPFDIWATSPASGNQLIVLAKIFPEVIYLDMSQFGVGATLGTNWAVKYSTNGTSFNATATVLLDTTNNLTQNGYIAIKKPTDAVVATINSLEGCALALEVTSTGITQVPKANQVIIYNAPPVIMEIENTKTSY